MKTLPITLAVLIAGSSIAMAATDYNSSRSNHNLAPTASQTPAEANKIAPGIDDDCDGLMDEPASSQEISTQSTGIMKAKEKANKTKCSN